jgi:hypothetical protein
MKQKTFKFIVEMIRNMKEEVVLPTNSASSGAVSGLSGKEGDLPPVDLRKKRYNKLPGHFKDLFRRKQRVQSITKS